MSFTYYAPEGYKVSDAGIDWETHDARNLLAAAYGWQKLDGGIDQCTGQGSERIYDENWERTRLHSVAQNFHSDGCAGVVPDHETDRNAAFHLTMMYADRLLQRDMGIPFNEQIGRLGLHVPETFDGFPEAEQNKASEHRYAQFHKHRYGWSRAPSYTSDPPRTKVLTVTPNEKVNRALHRTLDVVAEGLRKHREFIRAVGKNSPITTRVLVGMKTPAHGNLWFRQSMAENWKNADRRSFLMFEFCTAPENGMTLQDMWNFHRLGKSEDFNSVSQTPRVTLRRSPFHTELRDFKRRVESFVSWGMDSYDVHKPVRPCTGLGEDSCHHYHTSKGWHELREVVRSNYSAGWLTYPGAPNWRPVSDMYHRETQRRSMAGVVNLWKLRYGKLGAGETTFRVSSTSGFQKRRNSDANYFRSQVQSCVPLCLYCGKSHKKTDARKCAHRPTAMFDDGGVLGHMGL